MEHHELGCSKWPAFSKCGSFESEGSSDAADRGTLIHQLVETLNKGEKITGEHPADIMDEVNFAYEKTVDILMGDKALYERKIPLIDENWNTEYFTTLDVDGPQFLIDYKTGQEYDYYPQMAGMALAKMLRDGIDIVNCYIIYTKFKKVEKYTITQVEAQKVYEQVKYNYENKTLKANDYCKFCKHLTTCSEPTKAVNALVKGREDWEIDNFHSSQITDPEQMKQAYHLSKLVAKWADAVQYQIKAKILEGMKIVGLEIRNKKGRKTYTDLQAIYSEIADKITVEEYLQCCTITKTKLEKLCLEKGITKKEINQILDAHCVEGKPIQTLTEIK